jgi:alpha-amylase
MKVVLLSLMLVTLLACQSSSVKTTQENTTNTNDMNWIYSTNIYEVNLRQYTPEGTINAFLKELPRLKEMGVQTLWFMPITPIAQKNKKGSLGSYYAAADYTSVSPEFGTIEDFKNLVKEAHSMGLKVIIDWVANHTGWDHVWTKTHPEYYLIDSSTNDFLIASGMDDIIELNFSKPELRRAMIDAMKFWVQEADIDGFRADLAYWVELDFWQEAKKELEQTKPLFWLGELDPLEKPEYMQVFDAAYTWTWMHKAKEFYAGNTNLDSFHQVLVQYQNSPGMKAWFTTNHDENSWNGTEYEKYGDAAKALAVFTATWQGLPLIYSGQELPNTKRLEFFEKDPIKWTGDNKLHDFYKTLFNLHSTHPALDARVPVQRIETSDDSKVFAYHRKKDSKEVLVLLNLSPSSVKINLRNNEFTGAYRNVFNNQQMNINSSSEFEINKWEYLVLEK